MDRDAEEKTPPQGPFAMHLQRIEGKIDGVHTELRTIRTRTDQALTAAFAAHETAKTALWARASIGPYVVSGLAFAMAFATACAVLR